MSDINSKYLTRKMDLHGLIEREERRDVIRKQEEQEAAPLAAVRRGFESAYATERQKIRLRELAQADPAMFFFLVKNRSVSSV